MNFFENPCGWAEALHKPWTREASLFSYDDDDDDDDDDHHLPPLLLDLWPSTYVHDNPLKPIRFNPKESFSLSLSLSFFFSLSRTGLKELTEKLSLKLTINCCATDIYSYIKLFILKDRFYQTAVATDHSTTCPSCPLYEGFNLFEVTCKHFDTIQVLFMNKLLLKFPFLLFVVFCFRAWPERFWNLIVLADRCDVEEPRLCFVFNRLLTVSVSEKRTTVQCTGMSVLWVWTSFSNLC